jgi:hypothetical protein
LFLLLVIFLATLTMAAVAAAIYLVWRDRER